MEQKKDGGQAFPTGGCSDGKTMIWREGMTLRDYACIHLRVPETSHDWLNELIRKAQYNELEAKAMQGLMASRNPQAIVSASQTAVDARTIAHAIMRGRTIASAVIRDYEQ